MRVLKDSSGILALLLAFFVGAALAAPASTLAGTYTVSACGQSASTGEWAREESEPEHVEVHAACPVPAPHSGEAEPEGLFVTSVLGASSTAPNGASGAWSFSVPAGLSITALSGRVLLGGLPEWHLDVRTATATLTETSGEYTWSGLATNRLELVARCVVEAPASGCRDGATEHKFTANLDDPAVTIEDPTAPTLSSVNGALWSAHYAAGTLSASFDASDRLGIRRASLSVDGGAPIASSTYSCAENEYDPGTYTKIDPCADVSDGSLALDSASLADGTHTVKLTLEDPAGNTASAEHTIVVDNHGPPAPEDLAATETSASELRYLVTWSDPPSPPAPVAETLLRLCAQSTGACTASVQVSGTSSTITLPSAGPWAIYVQLVDTQGRSSPYASYFVLVPSPTGTETTTTHTSTLSPPPAPGVGSSTAVSTTHTSTPALTVSGVRQRSQLTVTAELPGAKNGTKVKLSAHVKKRNGTKVETCVGLATVKHGRATLTFKLSTDASSAPVIVVRARYSNRTAAARATGAKKVRAATRLARSCVRPSRGRRS